MGKSVHNEETRKLMEGILRVANMLRNHKTYNEVAEVTGASTATISRVNRCLNYGTDGYQLVLSRMEKLEKKED